MPEVYTLSGPTAGPTVAIFAGLHGDELAGVIAIEQLKNELRIERGTVKLVIGNPPAIAAKKRLINKNLNRCMYKENQETAQEDYAARELMAILDTCDALLDLHMFTDPKSKPFAICEPSMIPIAQKFDVDLISTGWTNIEKGTSDDYMYLKGKVGICLECGPKHEPERFAPFAKESVLIFLTHFGLITRTEKVSKARPVIIAADRVIHKTSKNFKLQSGFTNMQLLKEGQLIAQDGETMYVAKAGESIIFPDYHARIGDEACIIGFDQYYVKS